MDIINLTSFEKALASLFEVIKIYNCDKSDLIIRDSMIKRFEYTYLISLKMIKRYFSSGAFVFDNIDEMTFNEMIRQANKMGLLRSNLEKWDNFKQKRNLTSHTYDEKISQDVASIIEDFAIEAKYLLDKLKEKLA